jgi:FixJ family two-component response regulator
MTPASVSSSKGSPSAAVMPPTVFVVDDDTTARESMESMIRCAGWRPETFASGHEFLASSRTPAPSCLVVEMSLRDLHGLDLQQRVTTDWVGMPIIFVTDSADVPMTVRAMKAGAAEVLVKPVTDEVLLPAIEQAIASSRIAMLQESAAQVLEAAYASLTRREREVMWLVVSGRLNKQVAAELGISEITVKAHRGQAMRKMGARSLADLVKMAARLQDRPVVSRSAAMA